MSYLICELGTRATFIAQHAQVNLYMHAVHLYGQKQNKLSLSQQCHSRMVRTVRTLKSILLPLPPLHRTNHIPWASVELHRWKSQYISKVTIDQVPQLRRFRQVARVVNNLDMTCEDERGEDWASSEGT